MREVGDFLRRRREELANRGELSLAHQKQPQATRAAVQADRGGLPAKEQKETQDMGSEKDEENAFVNVSQGEEDSEQNQPVDDSSISAETVDTDFLPRGSSNHSGLHSFMEQSRQSVRPLQQESVYASPEFVRSSQRWDLPRRGKGRGYVE